MWTPSAACIVVCRPHCVPSRTRRRNATSARAESIVCSIVRWCNGSLENQPLAWAVSATSGDERYWEPSPAGVMNLAQLPSRPLFATRPVALGGC